MLRKQRYIPINSGNTANFSWRAALYHVIVMSLKSRRVREAI
jgi:hypothetical protein